MKKKKNQDNTHGSFWKKILKACSGTFYFPWRHNMLFLNSDYESGHMYESVAKLHFKKNQNHLVLSSRSVKNQHISYRFKIELTHFRNLREEKCCSPKQIPVNTLTEKKKEKKCRYWNTPLSLSDLWWYIPMLITVLNL